MGSAMTMEQGSRIQRRVVPSVLLDANMFHHPRGMILQGTYSAYSLPPKRFPPDTHTAHQILSMQQPIPSNP